MMSRRYRPAIAVAVLSMLVGAAAAVSAQAPAAQAPMNMANMDHRGGIRGTVRGADQAGGRHGGDGRQRRQRRALRGDDRRAGRVRVRRAARRQLQRHGRVGRRDRVPAARRGGTADQNVQLDITLDAASAQQAADAERQELLQQVADSSSASPIWNRTRCCRTRRRACVGSKSSSTRTATSTTSRCPGSKPVVTYRRERVYRRQTINEKIEEALADAEEHSVQIGVDAAITTPVREADQGRRHAGRQPRLRAGVRRPVLHRRHRPAHHLLRRHRRPERFDAGRGDSSR